MSDPIQINVTAPPTVVIDVTNKLANVTKENLIDALGYIPEDQANKVTDWSATPTDINYPSEKLVKDSIDAVLVEAWDAHVETTDLKNDDILIYSDSVSKFINRPKENLTDGGNY